MLHTISIQTKKATFNVADNFCFDCFIFADHQFIALKPNILLFPILSLLLSRITAENEPHQSPTRQHWDRPPVFGVFLYACVFRSIWPPIPMKLATPIL